MSALAQDINLSYSDGSVILPLDTNGSMTVNPITGDVNVVTSYSSAEIGDELGLQPTGIAPNINFTITENGTTSANISATISNDAVYCNKTGGLWSGLIQSTPPANYVTSVTQNNVTTNGSYGLTCANSFGITTDSGNVTNIVSVNPPVVNVTANPTTVTSGGSSTITWSATNTPTSCTFSNDWPVAERIIPTNSNPLNFTVTSITTSKLYTATCSNTAGSDSDSASVTVTTGGQNPNPWPSCAGTGAYILNGAEDRTILANGSSNGGSYNGEYEEIFDTTDPVQFPGDVGITMYLSITKNQYVAAQFNSGTPGRYARYSLNPPGNEQGPLSDATTITISECPGDFNEHLGQSTCKSNGSATGSLYWSDMPDANPNLFCKIDRNKTYYLNIVHSNDVSSNYQNSGCDSSYCGLIMTLRAATNPQ